MKCCKPFCSQFISKTVWLFLFILPILTVSCQSITFQSKKVDLEETDYSRAARLLRNIDRLNGQGRYAEAVFEAEKLCKIIEDEKGRNHLGVGVCLNVLGGLYESLGDYKKAEVKLKQALEINRRDPSLSATSLGLLAKTYMNQGEFLQAEPFATEALQIRERTSDDEFMVSTSLNTLGEIYLHLRKYSKAEPLLLRAIEIRKKHENTHSLVISLHNLSQLYYLSGYYPMAEQLGRATLEIGEYALGDSHPHIGETLNLLGKVTAAQGRYEEAFTFLESAQHIDFESIDHIKGFTSEAQKLKFLQKSRAELDVFLTLVLKHLPESPEALKAAMDTVLRRKGIVLDVQKQFQRALFNGDRQTLKSFEHLSRVRSQLTRLAFSGPGLNNLDDYPRQINRLREEKERLEIQISSRNRAYLEYRKKADANCEQVTAMLKAKPYSALVELIRVSLYNFESISDQRWSKDHYYAFILTAGNPYDLQAVDLGRAEDINALIFQFKERQLKIPAGSNNQVLTAAKQLYSRVFKPIKKALGNRKQVYLSPDGNLNLIPFEIFYDPRTGFLIENYTFNYISSGRDILGFSRLSEPIGKDILIGDPDFDLKTTHTASDSKKSADDGMLAEAVIRNSFVHRGLYFERLPGTRREVYAIQTLLGKDQTKVFTGKQATEQVLGQMGSPRILHLATHGFFLKDIEFASPGRFPQERGVSIMNEENPPAQRIRLENPLLQSGFALAGANDTLRSKDSIHFEGIVTAEKILGLNLMSTEMVVLSACNTGVGEVKTGEGVFGLRRAFTQAGTKSLVMSMWSVPDTETQELMVAFYRNYLLRKMDRCQALRKAALEELDVVKKRYGFPYPYFWGAFVFMGES